MFQTRHRAAFHSSSVVTVAVLTVRGNVTHTATVMMVPMNWAVVGASLPSS